MNPVFNHIILIPYAILSFLLLRAACKNITRTKLLKTIRRAYGAITSLLEQHWGSRKTGQDDIKTDNLDRMEVQNSRQTIVFLWNEKIAKIKSRKMLITSKLCGIWSKFFAVPTKFSQPKKDRVFHKIWFMCRICNNLVLFPSLV